MTTPPEIQLLDVSEVANLISLSSRTVWRMVSQGVFPKPFHIRKRARWKREDVLTWLNQYLSSQQ